MAQERKLCNFFITLSAKFESAARSVQSKVEFLALQMQPSLTHAPPSLITWVLRDMPLAGTLGAHSRAGPCSDWIALYSMLPTLSIGAMASFTLLHTVSWNGNALLLQSTSQKSHARSLSRAYIATASDGWILSR